MKYYLEAKIDNEWTDMFVTQPTFNTIEEAQIYLNKWLYLYAKNTGMDNNPTNYKITECLR